MPDAVLLMLQVVAVFQAATLPVKHLSIRTGHEPGEPHYLLPRSTSVSQCSLRSRRC